MYLQRLEARYFRNLKNFCFEPGPSINLIYGENSSGKSSLLEAIYFLGTGKSFRNPKSKLVIQEGKPQFSISAQFHSDTGKIIKTQIKRDHQNMHINVDGEYVNRASTLAGMFPIQIIEPNLHQFLNDGPEFRRRYVEWGVFHVEQQYERLRKLFYRHLNQRNAALKQNLPDRQIQEWDIGVARAGLEIDLMRKAFIEKVSHKIQSRQNLPEPLTNITLDYYQGWPRESTFIESLNANLPSDKERGFTQLGPHRADIRIKVGKQLAKDVLSRGQQKLLASSFILSQCQILNERLQKNVILLIDDMCSEMDTDSQKLLINMIKNTQCQTFITSINKNDLLEVCKGIPFRMFHVEHGHVSQVV